MMNGLPLNPSAIAFDFDGTLVNSAPGILTGIRLALEKNGITPCHPLEQEIIGPPLKQTLALVSGSQDESLLSRLATNFKQCYDNGGYRDTIPYPHIKEALVTLHAAGYQLYLVTNKRGIPSRLILNDLGWSSFFDAIYCLDEHPECADKTQLLQKLIHQQQILTKQTPYVGDTESDSHAAITNHMPYLHVTWGYGDSRPSATCYLDDPSQLAPTLLSHLG